MGPSLDGGQSRTQSEVKGHALRVHLGHGCQSRTQPGVKVSQGCRGVLAWKPTGLLAALSQAESRVWFATLSAPLNLNWSLKFLEAESYLKNGNNITYSPSCPEE